jgi:hypothetical protein
MTRKIKKDCAAQSNHEPVWTPLSELASKLAHLRPLYPGDGELERAIEKALRSGEIPIRGVKATRLI